MPVDNIIVKINFDPWATEKTQDIFFDDFTRTFYLLWVNDHPVNDTFAETWVNDHPVNDTFTEACAKLSRKWKAKRPMTPQELIDSIPMEDEELASVQEFVAKYDAYLFGDARVGFVTGHSRGQG